MPNGYGILADGLAKTQRTTTNKKTKKDGADSHRLMPKPCWRLFFLVGQAQAIHSGVIVFKFANLLPVGDFGFGIA